MAGFALDIKKNIAAFNVGVEQAVRGTAIQVFSSIVESTPVDEGRARASWIATGQKPSTRVTTNEDKNGTATISAIQSTVSSLKDYSAFTLTSNLPYINVLEFGLYGSGDKTVNGFSKQAPNGMLRINMNRAAKVLEEQAARNLPK